MKLNRELTIQALREHIKKCNLNVNPDFFVNNNFVKSFIK